MKLKDIEIVKWNDISSQFQHVFPELHAEFDRIFKKHSARFFRIRYPFGTEPLTRGELNIPLHDRFVSSTSPDLPAEIRAELNYGTIPVTAVLKGSIESYINLPHHLIPLRVLKPGRFFGLYGSFHQSRTSHIIENAYSYMAGSRSLLILPKISNEQYSERLVKNYNISREVLAPKTLAGQWELFRELAHSPHFKSQWETELIIFPKSTFEIIKQDINTHYILLNRVLNYNFFAQNQMMYDLVWSIFFEKLSTSIKNAPSILETVKHVIKLCISEAPGYTPIIDEGQGPIKELVDIFLNVYRIRYFLPSFMEIGFYNHVDPIYYSLQKHTFFCNMPEKASANRTIDELVAIKRLIQSFKQQVLDNKFPFSLEDTMLYKTLQEVEFDFYHPQNKGNVELNTDIAGLISEDPRFMALLQGFDYDPALSLPTHSLFFNGCIRIRPTKKIAKPLMKDVLGPRGLASFRLDDKE